MTVLRPARDRRGRLFLLDLHGEGASVEKPGMSMPSDPPLDAGTCSNDDVLGLGLIVRLRLGLRLGAPGRARRSVTGSSRSRLVVGLRLGSWWGSSRWGSSSDAGARRLPARAGCARRADGGSWRTPAHQISARSPSSMIPSRAGRPRSPPRPRLPDRCRRRSRPLPVAHDRVPPFGSSTTCAGRGSSGREDSPTRGGTGRRPRSPAIRSAGPRPRTG